MLVLGIQPSATCPCGRHFLKRLKSGCTCFVEVLLRDEWYSMYTVSSAPDMELIVPKRRDTCRGTRPAVSFQSETPSLLHPNHSKIYKFISFIDFIIFKITFTDYVVCLKYYSKQLILITCVNLPNPHNHSNAHFTEEETNREMK